MATNCNKFVCVNAGDNCNGISFFNGPISTGDFEGCDNTRFLESHVGC